MNEKFSAIAPEKLSEITLTSRLDAISEAQMRARVAFFLSTLAAGIILAALWNLYLSWDRQWADLTVQPEGWGRGQLIMQQIKSWMESQLVGVPLLGFRLSVSDTAVLGSIVLLNFSFYYCHVYATRESGNWFADRRYQKMSLTRVDEGKFRNQPASQLLSTLLSNRLL